MSEISIEMSDLPKPELVEIPKSKKNGRRRSPRRSTSPFDSKSDYLRYKSKSPIRKKTQSKTDDTAYVVELDVSPNAKQKITGLLSKGYPNAIEISKPPKLLARNLFSCGPPTNISFIDTDGVKQTRCVTVYVSPKKVDFAQALKVYRKTTNNFSLSAQRFKPKQTLDEVAAVSSVDITADDIHGKEPIRRDHANFGASAIQVAQQYLYADKSIWDKVQNNKEKLGYLVECQENFAEKLKSDKFKEVVALLKHPDVLKELDNFLTLDLEETLKNRITILMLLRAFELCHKQPHHTLTPELLEEEPFRNDTTSAPSYINKV